MSSPIVISALFFQSSTYDDQYMRSFTTHFDGGVSSRLLNDTDDGRNLTVTSLSRSVGDAIRMQAKAGSRIEIPGGWGEKRLSFIITLLTSDYNGSKQRQVLSGYTDYDGVNMLSGTLDENMVMFVNNSIIIRDTVLDTGRGRVIRPRIESSEYIIRGREPSRRAGFGQAQGDRLIRPHDIFNAIGVSDIQRMSGGNDEVIDTRADIIGDIKMATRRDNNAADYLHSVIRTGVMAETTEPRSFNAESQFGGEEQSKSEVAAGALNFSRVEDNPAFTEFLAECNFAQNGEITLGQMRNCVDWPSLYRGEQVTKFINPQEVAARGYRSYNRGEGADWKGSGRSTTAMALIAQSIPALCMTHHIADAWIEFSNDNIQCEMRVVVGNLRALIPGANVEGFAGALEDLIRIQVANPVSHNGEVLVSAKIDCSVVTDVKITLKIEDEPEVERTVPMYCDGLISPQKTDDMQAANKIMNDVSMTINTISDRLFQSADDRTEDSLSGFSWDR